jgi:hypothetical protein
MDSGFAFSSDTEERKLKLALRCAADKQKEPRLAGGAEQRQKASRRCVDSSRAWRYRLPRRSDAR